MSSKIEIFLPWDSPNYIPCNGFHPLYQSLICELNNFDFYRGGPNYYLKKSKKNQTLKLSKKYYKFYSANHIHHNFKNNYIEMHHTVPLVNGKTYFIFHCESFFPIFMPYAFQGQGFLDKKQEFFDHFHEIFSSDFCLGIISHIPETLEEISKFFNNEKIDKKLSFFPFTLPKMFLEKSNINTKKISSNKKKNSYTFLFSNSASQNDGQFILRGGIIVLKLALKLLRSTDMTFIFQCKRPSNEDIESNKISIKDVQYYTENNKIIWHEEFLELDYVKHLYKIADFFILPSVNLHSVSLVQALSSKTIPIVLDLPMMSNFIKDNISGIVIDNVSQNFYTKVDNIYWLDNHEEYKISQDLIFQKLEKKIKSIINDHQYILKLKSSCFEFYTKNFSPSKNTTKFSKLMHEIIDKSPKNKFSLKGLNNEGLIKVLSNDFYKPIKPKMIINFPSFKVFESILGYYAIRNFDVETGPKYWEVNPRSKFKKIISLKNHNYFSSKYDDISWQLLKLIVNDKTTMFKLKYFNYREFIKLYFPIIVKIYRFFLRIRTNPKQWLKDTFPLLVHIKNNPKQYLKDTFPFLIKIKNALKFNK